MGKLIVICIGVVLIGVISAGILGIKAISSMAIEMDDSFRWG